MHSMISGLFADWHNSVICKKHFEIVSSNVPFAHLVDQLIKTKCNCLLESQGCVKRSMGIFLFHVYFMGILISSLYFISWKVLLCRYIFDGDFITYFQFKISRAPFFTKLWVQFSYFVFCPHSGNKLLNSSGSLEWCLVLHIFIKVWLKKEDEIHIQ